MTEKKKIEKAFLFFSAHQKLDIPVLLGREDKEAGRKLHMPVKRHSINRYLNANMCDTVFYRTDHSGCRGQMGII